jgi:DNA-binding NarL/FixJ family response regulator
MTNRCGTPGGEGRTRVGDLGHRTGEGPLPGRRQLRITRVLIVEDERLMGELLAAVVEEEPDLRVVGVATSVAEVAKYHARRPELVLMDYRLPDGTGAEATRMIKARWPATRVLMLSALQDDETVLESIRAGADGYLSKDRAADEIVAAIRATRNGETLLPPALLIEIARRVMVGRAKASTDQYVEPLTPRQREILRELACGRSAREICERLTLSPNTLRTHIQRILAKLGAHSKLEAVTTALRLGIVALPHDAEPAAQPAAHPGILLGHDGPRRQPGADAGQ